MSIFSFTKESNRFNEENFTAIEQRLAVLREHMTVHRVEVGRISPSPLFPAREENLPALSKSILRFGLIEPLTVRRVSRDDSSLGAVFQLIDGNRRLAAAKTLGIASVPCYIVNIPPAELEQARISAVCATRTPDIFEKADAEAILKEGTASLFASHSTFATMKHDPLHDISEKEREICRTEQLDEQMITSFAKIKDRNARAQMLCEIVRIRKNCLKRTENRASPRNALGKLLLCDIRPVYNSFERYVRFLRQSGIPSSWRKEESEECYRIVLEIPKKTYCNIGAPTDPPPFERAESFDFRDFAL